MITNAIFDGCSTVVGWMGLDIRKASLLMRGRKENGIGWDGIREPDRVRCRLYTVEDGGNNSTRRRGECSMT